MIYRILAFLFLLIFVFAIIFASLPLTLFEKEKPVVHVLLMDISKSAIIKSDEIDNFYNRIESVLPFGDSLVRGYFADKSIYMDEGLKSIDESNKKLILQEWFTGGETYKPYLNLNITNLEMAVREAFEKWSSKGLIHVVMVTDAKENNGKLINLGEFVKKNDLLLTIVPIKENPEDVFVRDLYVPDTIAVNQPIEIKTNIFATGNYKKIVLQILIDNKETIQKEVELKTGKNSFAFETSFQTPGIFEMTAKVVLNDSFPENNAVTIQVKTTDIKEVLLVTEEPNSFLASLLKNSKMITPIGFPRNVSELINFNSIVLENIHWNKLLDVGKMEALKEYVKRGGKLFVSGGFKSFGFGDYMGNSIEALLPVKINPSGLISMIVGIDISGSMESDVGGMRKIDIAINSLLDISKSLEPNDELGVHLYNENKVKNDLWIPITKIKDFESIMKNKIKIMPKPTGGTFILPALQTIYEALANNEKKLRIAVMITDGETQENNFEETLKKFQQIKPPINVILIGADLSLESPLVLAGKNIFGDTWTPVNINAVGWPNLNDCFKEALKKVATFFSDEGQFKIFANQAHPISHSIQPFVSPYKGIILKTSLKPGASTLLDIDDRFPLLAHKYFGMGEVISFQSGFYENWAGVWLNSDQGKSFQSMLGSWLLQSKSNPIKLVVENSHEGFLVKINSQLKSMEKYAEIQFNLKGNSNTCIRSGNTSWSCFLNWQEASDIKPNDLFQIKYRAEDGKDILAGEGIFPQIISKEIFDIYDPTLLANHFPNNSKKWRWADDKIPKIEVKSYQQVSNIKFFFLVALISFLLAIFFRGRVG